jgi:hypothetical protein
VGRKQPDERNLSSNLEQAINELRLANRIGFAIHLTLPFLTISIASMPRSVRHGVAKEP